jgi:hypothetical protein
MKLSLRQMPTYICSCSHIEWLLKFRAIGRKSAFGSYMVVRGVTGSPRQHQTVVINESLCCVHLLGVRLLYSLWNQISGRASLNLGVPGPSLEPSVHAPDLAHGKAELVGDQALRRAALRQRSHQRQAFQLCRSERSPVSMSDDDHARAVQCQSRALAVERFDAAKAGRDQPITQLRKAE